MPTFLVSDDPRGALSDELDIGSAVRSLLHKPVEAMCCDAKRMVSCDALHAFAKAAHDAFYDHHPLVIRPDDIWFCITQGLANHVAQDREALRSQLVPHQGEMKLVVERLDFVLGQPNPWPEVFAAFSSQIGAHVGALRELVSVCFSTTTTTESAAFDVCLMDAFQGYFEYEMREGCGIPEFTLLGTPDDWHAMRARLSLLSRYGLAWWVAALDPVLAKVAETAAGRVDPDFWRSFFRYQSGSGPAELTGWMVTLFPYLTDKRVDSGMARNPYLATWHERFEIAQTRGLSPLPWGGSQGPGIRQVPGSLVSAPVRFVDVRDGSEILMRFVAGMFGVDQNSDSGALSSAFGWAVVHDV